MFHQASEGVKQWCAYASELRLQDISVRLQNVNINADVKYHTVGVVEAPSLRRMRRVCGAHAQSLRSACAETAQRMFRQASEGMKQWCAYASELRLQDVSVRLQNVNINADVK
jgi:hypothetical protein